MIWTDNIYNLVDNMTEELYKNLDKPHNQNCVTRAAYENMTLQEYICIQKKDIKIR